jgi:AcrR family transcriptional regulator
MDYQALDRTHGCAGGTTEKSRLDCFYNPRYEMPRMEMVAARSGRTRRRRTQHERRQETRAAVLDATVECLADFGYAGATTTRIARRARVSRGALLHYYSSKIELLTSALEHILHRRIEEFRAAFAEVPAHLDRRAAAIDLLWKMFSSSTFYAWLELVVAARSNRKLKQQVSAVTTRFADDVLAIYRELFPETVAAPVSADLVTYFTFAFLQGLALDQIAVEDDPRLNALLEVLKGLASMILGTPAKAAGV